jgi:hypothetical protein
MNALFSDTSSIHQLISGQDLTDMPLHAFSIDETWLLQERKSNSCLLDRGAQPAQNAFLTLYATMSLKNTGITHRL